ILLTSLFLKTIFCILCVFFLCVLCASVVRSFFLTSRIYEPHNVRPLHTSGCLLRPADASSVGHHLLAANPLSQPTCLQPHPLARCPPCPTRRSAPPTIANSPALLLGAARSAAPRLRCGQTPSAWR